MRTTPRGTERNTRGITMSEGGVDKTLLALLNGLSKREYFHESELSDEFLRTEVMGGLAEEEYAVLARRYLAVLHSLVSADMDFTQLEAFLTSQMKKRQGAMTPQEAATVTKFWKNQKTKIHQQLVSESMWGSRLKGLSWRIDVKTKARHIDQLNQPTAIVEAQLGDSCSDKAKEIVRFELDEKKLSELLVQVADVEKAIEKQTHS